MNWLFKFKSLVFTFIFMHSAISLAAISPHNEFLEPDNKIATTVSHADIINSWILQINEACGVNDTVIEGIETLSDEELAALVNSANEIVSDCLSQQQKVDTEEENTNSFELVSCNDMAGMKC